MNKKIERVRPELHPVPVKSPWFHVGMDSLDLFLHHHLQVIGIYLPFRIISQNLDGQKLYLQKPLLMSSVLYER